MLAILKTLLILLDFVAVHYAETHGASQPVPQLGGLTTTDLLQVKETLHAGKVAFLEKGERSSGTTLVPGLVTALGSSASDLLADKEGTLVGGIGIRNPVTSGTAP